jgi:hypothetical protein
MGTVVSKKYPTDPARTFNWEDEDRIRIVVRCGLLSYDVVFIYLFHFHKSMNACVLNEPPYSTFLT